MKMLERSEFAQTGGKRSGNPLNPRREGGGSILPRAVFFGLIAFCAILFFGRVSSFALEGGADVGRPDAFVQAEHHFNSGSLLEAQAFYLEFLNHYPSDSRAEQALYRLGQIDFRNRSFRTALRYFNFILTNAPNSSFLHRAKFDMAECHFNLGDYGEAEDLFREELKVNPDVKKRWEAALYLGKIDERRADYNSAVAKLNYVHNEGIYEDLKIQAARLIEEIIDKKLSKVNILSLSRKARGDFPLDLLLLKLQSIYRLEGDRESYQVSLEEFLRRLPKHPQRNDVEKRLAQVRGTKPKVVRLGAVLPLTGKYALTGQQVLQGIQLALNEISAADRETLELVVKNSGDLQSIYPIVEELATDPSVVGVIGPVFSNHIKEIAPLLDKYQLPVFTPTASTPGLTQASPYIFRNALTRENQAKFLAEYAFNHLSLRRFAILHSDDSYGVELKDIFTREVDALGGQIVATVSYNRSQTDFKEQILQLGGMTDGALRKLSDQKSPRDDDMDQPDGRTPLSRPIIKKEMGNDGQVEGVKIFLELSYDAVFIPGFHDKVGLIAPQLAFYNIDNAILLGANGWNSPDLARIAGKYLRKGVFVDGFFVNAQEKQVREFVKSFKATFADDPTIYSAQSYDAARMMIELIRNGAKNRPALKEQLHSIRDFPGVSGKTTILPSGEAEKSLFALKIKGDKIVQAD